ncbi:MAG: hypothetical protein CBC09_06730 [Cellvibrionales bacterium TMED49]|nr:multidrug transporter [Porticoccaceae bacterium]OUU37730.1 MAG: hypothetical protein CBC09_06730 [Cellvibrionales bacterium TMED49]
MTSTEHLDHCVIAEKSYAMGDGMMHVMVFPPEFRAVQHHFPIFFAKDPETGSFYPTALLGLEQDENLFLESHGWGAHYLPMMMERSPFFISFQSSIEGEKRPVVSIDMDSARVTKNKGIRLFQDSGEPSKYLQDVVKKLEAIHKGHQHNKDFASALLELELLESCNVEVGLEDGSQRKLTGFYALNEDKLHKLDGESLSSLHSNNFLHSIYMCLASYSRISTLVEKKNFLIRAKNKQFVSEKEVAN